MKLVFVVCLRTHLLSMEPMIVWGRKSGFHVSVFFANNYNMAELDAERIMEVGCNVLFAPNRHKSLLSRILICDYAGVPLRRFWRTARHLLQVCWFYRRLFKKLGADVVVIPEENIGYLSTIVVKAAHSAYAKCMVVPYTIDNPLEAAEAYYQRRAFQVFPDGSATKEHHREVFAAWFSQWTRTHKGVTIFRFPWRIVFAFELLRLAPPNPWQNTCSFADAVCVESEAISKMHKKSGVDASKIHVIGSVVLDQMARLAKEADFHKAVMLQELGLDPSRPVFLVALPPDQFNTGREDCEFVDHSAVVAFWLETLAATGWNVAVNLHPHLKPQDIDFGSWTNVKYCARPTAEVIPLCDVFVASISATIRWAIACGKTVINHDLYLYRYDDYIGAPGVIHLETKAQFAAEVARVAQEVPRAVPHADWGILDGKSGERLLNLLSSLTSSSPPS